MFVKVEPTGCCERKGMVQVRFSFFLDKGDARYAECRVKDNGVLVSVPFHNHFVYVAPDTSDADILDIGERFLKQAYGFWEKDQFPALGNAPVSAPEITAKRRVECMDKADRFNTADSADLMRKV